MAHARKARTALGLAFRDSSFRLGRCSRCCFPLSDGDGATPGSIHIDERNKHFAVTHTCTEDGTFRSRWCESNSARTMRRRGGSVRYCQNSTPPARETTLRWLRSERRERRRRGVGCSPSRRRSERRLVFPSRQQTTVVDSKRRSERHFLLLFFFFSGQRGRGRLVGDLEEFRRPLVCVRGRRSGDDGLSSQPVVVGARRADVSPPRPRPGKTGGGGKRWWRRRPATSSIFALSTTITFFYMLISFPRLFPFPLPGRSRSPNRGEGEQHTTALGASADDTGCIFLVADEGVTLADSW